MRFISYIGIIASVLVLPLVPLEARYNTSELEYISSIINYKSCLRMHSIALTIQYKVPDEYQYFFINWNYDYDPLILARIIEVESGWREKTIGPENFDGSHDYGIAQLNSNYHDYFENRYWNKEESFDPLNGHHGLFIAAEQLQMLYTRLGTQEKMIMAYNIGIGSVLYRQRMRSGEIYLRKVKNIW